MFNIFNRNIVKFSARATGEILVLRSFVIIEEILTHHLLIMVANLLNKIDDNISNNE